MRGCCCEFCEHAVHLCIVLQFVVGMKNLFVKSCRENLFCKL